MADTGKIIGLIKALGSPSPEAISGAVNDWLDDHPEATTTVEDGSITKAKLDSNLQGTVDDVDELKSAIDDLDERVEDLEEGGSGMSMTAVNLLNTILGEALYGTDQTANIALLYKELSNVKPVSISAVLDGIALVGQNYSDLSFTVTATFDDQSTQTVTGYTIATQGTVVSGSNTVTISYRGITTTCTFTAESVITYTITYNLTDVISSNNTTVIEEDERYETTLSVEDADHYIDSVVVTMGGVDVTSSVYVAGQIVIAEVTGNVVITAVAAQYTYLTLIAKRGYGTEGDSTCYLYTDEYTTPASTQYIAYYHVGTITPYRAKQNCTITYTVTNNSESAVSLNQFGVGLIDGDNLINQTQSAVAYWQAINNSSYSLDPGASLTGTYNVLAGYQLIFTTTVSTISALTINAMGNFVSEEFEDYTTVFNGYSDTPLIDQTYRNYTYYSDDGTTALGSFSGYALKLGSIAAGTYDIAMRAVNTNQSGNVKCANVICVGAITAGQSASHYAIMDKHKYVTDNVWLTGQIRVTASDMYLTFMPGTSLDSNGGARYLDIRLKEVV